MPTYHVSKTAGGGYWITDSALDSAFVGTASAVGSAAGSAIGGVLEGVLTAVSNHNARNAQEKWEREASSLQKLSESRDHDTMYLAVADYVRNHPNDAFGYDVMASAALGLDRPKELPDNCVNRGGARGG
jgi:hypothetical protein